MSSTVLKQFGVAYHKSIKKLLLLSTHESNHYACQEAKLLIFQHLINKLKINTAYRFFKKPCRFFDKILEFLMASSEFLKEINELLVHTYDVDSLLDNDLYALYARIEFVQNHESQMRGPLVDM